MKTIDPEILASLMVQADYHPGSQPSKDLLRLVSTVVEHCAEIADCTEVSGKQYAGAQIREEWGVQ